MSILVGRWDCAACGHKGVKGPLTRCPNCGSARPENVTFYLPDEEEVVTDAEEIRKAKSGADWVCSHCSTHNKAWENQCNGCGSPRDEAQEGDRQLEERDLPLHRPKAAPTSPSPRRGGNKKTRIAFGAVAALVVLLFVIFMQESEYLVKVEAHRWQREVAVEQYRQVEEEDWQVPPEGRVIKSFKAIHHTERKLRGYETRTRTVRVKVGEEQYVAGTRDLGNGNFEKIYKTRPVYEERQETYEEPVYDEIPVYRTKYRYAIFRWKRADPLRASGNGTDAYWPELPRKEDPKNWRTGERSGRYTLVVSEENGKKHEEEVSQSFWRSVQDGQEIKARKGAVMGGFRGLVTE